MCVFLLDFLWLKFNSVLSFCFILFLYFSLLLLCLFLPSPRITLNEADRNKTKFQTLFYVHNSDGVSSTSILLSGEGGGSWKPGVSESGRSLEKMSVICKYAVSFWHKANAWSLNFHPRCPITHTHTHTHTHTKNLFGGTWGQTSNWEGCAPSAPPPW